MKFFNLTASEQDGVKVLDVTLYGDIDMGFFSDGVASAEIARMLAEHPDAKKITQRINSRGGDMFGGIAIYNALQNHGAEVVSIIEGQAGSAASIAAMAGRTIAQRGSMLMVHSPIAGVMGNAADHRELADVLDKARDGLVAIYKAKTGKTPSELKKMLDAETWMTAEEAKASGFVDEIAAAPVKVKAEGEVVFVNEVPFARAGVPAQILAMATTPPPVEAEPEPSTTAPVLLDAAQPLMAEMLFTREVIMARAPDVIAALLAEGRAAGVVDERTRLKAIDELGLKGCDDLVIAAKYGEKPMDARDLAVAVLKAGKQAAVELLEARGRESAVMAHVRQSNPTKSNEAAEMEAIQQIADGINPRRGGAR